jgi:ABC-type proline/glycine betaine transport system permease subunit
MALSRSPGSALFYSRVGTLPTYDNAHNIIAQISFFLVTAVRFCKSTHQTLPLVFTAALRPDFTCTPFGIAASAHPALEMRACAGCPAAHAIDLNRALLR